MKHHRKTGNNEKNIRMGGLKFYCMFHGAFTNKIKKEN
ncbi:hypothetical protein B4146_0650 [Bacillus subtilis]|uniref:Uncharacterized protein n=1 Tax=Bacillus subtilis TaxID=1423 RepID=A0AAP1E088_BACIU|nr:hypothetical protein B4146_0650 [Bacillus subtilis]KZD90718.1 hypothetical protein B4122_2797 [Bacillus subtilis]